MRKTLLIVSLLLISFLSYAQSELLTYTEVIETTAPKDELYNRAKAWTGKMFKMPKEVIQIDDKEAGALSVRANSTVRVKGNIYTGTAGAGDKTCWYTLTLNFKDNKWKYELTNIGYRDEGLTKEEKKNLMTKSNRPYREACIAEVESLITNLKMAMSTSTEW